MFTPFNAKKIAELKKTLPGNPSVLEMGTQTYSVSRSAVEELKNSFVRDYDFFLSQKPAQKPTHTSALTQQFYQALGYDTYHTIDITNAHIEHDLNLPYTPTQKYDLVSNICTSPHLIGQAAFFKTMHDASHNIMLHLVPYQGYSDHAFFKYTPRFFYDLASYNNYEILECRPANRYRDFDSRILETMGTNVQYFSPKGMSLFVTLRKTAPNKEFVLPIEGTYREIENHKKMKKTPATRTDAIKNRLLSITSHIGKTIANF